LQDWHAKSEICQNCGENPAFVIFPGEGGKKVFSLWVGGKIWIAASPDGPFAVMPKATYPGGNPAPVYHDGAFYLTNQKTTEIYTTTKLGNATATSRAGCLGFRCLSVLLYTQTDQTSKSMCLVQSSIDDPEGWTVYSEISHATVPANWMIEDPCVSTNDCCIPLKIELTIPIRIFPRVLQISVD
jgi:hypothetical protein